MRARAGLLRRSLPGLSKTTPGTWPPAVAYRLTPPGERFVELVERLSGCGRANADALERRPTFRRRARLG
ncbi:hypothetical protein [Methylobacterium sp. J-068]|uniref:hypothetical protein n=1 Tax=Methylobacterium sp. J-068 TaxID=2836649 RepID=UPI001FBA72E0|nr:hypothetical protein [Methylobacterium sp. J-068]MCJ2033879.1 hypothetical protein [Methylobacterium sp. J-068]